MDGRSVNGNGLAADLDGTPCNGDGFGSVASVDSRGVRRKRARHIDFEAPDIESVAVVENDVCAGSVPDRDAVKREVVGAVGNDQPRNLLGPARAGLPGQIPPRKLRPKHFFAAAAINDAIAHHAGAGRVVDGDERFAAAGARDPADDAATARRGRMRR
jgi:hypothetical protein